MILMGSAQLSSGGREFPVLVETPSRFEHEGQSFEANGAYRDPYHLVGWIARPHTLAVSGRGDLAPGDAGHVVSWDTQAVIGTYRVVSSWKVSSFVSTRRFALRITSQVNGETWHYHGRSFGLGMVVFAKRDAAELRRLARSA